MHADDDDADDVGRADPESRARTHLANERTFLAWFRTGFTMIALGVAASQFLGAQRPADVPVALALVVGIVALAFVLFVSPA